MATFNNDAAWPILSGMSYALGAARRPVTSLPRLEETLALHGLPADISMLGLEYFHESAADAAAMAVKSCRRSLDAAGCPPETIDALIYCSTGFGGDTASHAAELRAVIEGVGLSSCFPAGVTLDRCAGLLAGLRLAAALVSAGMHHHVLVVTSDRFTSDQARLTNFALFSDGAASCIVSGTPSTSIAFDILASAAATEPDQMRGDGQISVRLCGTVNRQLAAQANLDLHGIRTVFATNIFQPITVMKEVQGGFRPDQIYLDNVTRIGHCFAADPVVNAADALAASPASAGDHFALVASVPGFRAGLILRAR